MKSLRDEFMRPGSYDINLPKAPLEPEEHAIVLQDDGTHWLALIGGVSHRLGEKEARKLQKFLTEYLGKFD